MSQLNPLIKETPAATLAAVREFARVLCVGATLDEDQPQGLALGLQVICSALEAEVLKKIAHE